MKTVSSEFRTATTATVRKPKARVHIVWAALEIDPAIQVSTDTVNRAANIDQVVDSNKKIEKKWAHLAVDSEDEARIKADGTWIPMPTPVANESPNVITPYNLSLDQVGWFGSESCGADAEFANDQILTIVFDARPITSLVVVGDDYWDEYPVDFTIDLYSGSYDFEKTVTVTDNDSVEYTNTSIETESLSDITKMVLTITKWSAAYRVVKIAEFYSGFSQTFDGDTIKSLSVLEERVISDGTLPVGNISSNEIDLTLQNIKIGDVWGPFFPANPDTIYKNVLIKNRKITPYIGFELPDGSDDYVKLGTFWTGDWKAEEGSATVSVQARDRMELLRLAEYPGSEIYEDEDLKTLLEVVLEYAKANVSHLSDLTWEIDEELEDYSIPWAWIPKCDYFKAIKTIVEACMGVAYMDKDDVLIIEGPSALTSLPDDLLEITPNNYFTRQQPSKSEELKNRVEITTQPLVVGESEEIYKTGENNKITIGSGGSTTATVYYSKKPVDTTDMDEDDVSCDNGTCTNADFYATHAVLTITGDADDETSVTITGTPLEVQGEEIIIEEDESSMLTNGVQTYSYPKNYLIQTRAMAEDIAAELLASYRLPRKDVSVEWRGNPALELGDTLRLPEYWRGAVTVKGDFKVTKNKIDFDGTLKMTTDARKISGASIGVYQDADDADYIYQDTDDGELILQG
jgi:hypothetical protein